MKNKKVNYWKIATLILGFICLLLIFVDTLYLEEKYDFNNVIVTKTDMDNFADVAKDNGKDKIEICDLKTYKCITINILDD